VNSNITVVEICIFKLFTCIAATRKPRMTTSDFMVYDSSVKLAAQRLLEGIYTYFTVKSSSLLHVTLSFQKKD